MTRREALALFAAAIPSAAVSVETELKPSDLVILEYRDHLTQEEAARIRTVWNDAVGTGGPKVIVLDAGLTARVERGILRVEDVA